MTLPTDYRLDDYAPGDLGRVVELHARYYAEHWGFGLYFETKVASELARFLQRLRPGQDRFWALREGDRLVGSVSIDGGEKESAGAAHLRWFIMEASCQGKGLGRALIDDALAFVRAAGYPACYLWTFAGLGAARRLYDEAGFTLTQEREDSTWGKTVLEQRFDLTFD